MSETRQREDAEMEAVQKWLSRGRDIDKEIGALLELRARLFTQACGTGGASERERVQESRKNRAEQAMVRLLDLERKIDRKIDELAAAKEEIFEAVFRVDDGLLRTLLVERYLNFKTWEQVAEGIGYASVGWVRDTLHVKALRQIRSSKMKTVEDDSPTVPSSFE